MQMVRSDVPIVQNIWNSLEFTVLVVMQSYAANLDEKNTNRLYRTYNYY